MSFRINIYKSKHKHTVIATVSVLTRLVSQLTSSKRNARKDGTFGLSACQIIENTQTHTQAAYKCVRLYVSSLTRCEFHIYLTYSYNTRLFLYHISPTTTNNHRFALYELAACVCMFVGCV